MSNKNELTFQSPIPDLQMELREKEILLILILQRCF